MAVGKKNLKEMSDEQLKEYFEKRKQALEAEKEKLLKDRQLRAAKLAKARRPKIDHAKYILAGEFLKSPEGKNFVVKLSNAKNFSLRDTNDLNLLCAEYGIKAEFKQRQEVVTSNNKD